MNKQYKDNMLGISVLHICFLICFSVLMIKFPSLLCFIRKKAVRGMPLKKLTLAVEGKFIINYTVRSSNWSVCNVIVYFSHLNSNKLKKNQFYYV